MKSYNFKVNKFVGMTFLLALLVSGKLSSADWVYKQDSEKLTDKQYSLAAGFAFNYQYNNDFTVSFQCTDGKVRFEINADRLINSKGGEFSFAYRVDKRESRQITMRTYSNESQGGYTYANVEQIAKDILGGSNIFVRAVTWNNDYLDAQVSLSGSDRAIKRVFSDCSASLDSSPDAAKSKYSLNQFNRSFKKLTPAQQEEVLHELEGMMAKF